MTRFERDGDLGVVVIDDPPLNLFGRELTKAGYLFSRDLTEPLGVRR